MKRKNLYRMHRVLSTCIGVPIFLWAVSGLMHPLMTSVRPQITTQAGPDINIPVAVFQHAFPLKRLLQQAAIAEACQVHLIHMDTSWYYQILPAPTKAARYFNIQNGRELLNGDQLYAASLARHFLLGKTKHPGIPIQSIKLINDYTDQYTYVNRLLPVYKVSFLRPDRIAIYVDTHNSRFAFALDRHRAAFNRFFGWFHTWSWMDRLPRLKAGIIAMILLLTLFTASLGIYLSFATKAKRHKTHPLIKARRLHRLTAITGAFFLLAWAFSGLIHALQNGRSPFKIRPVTNEMIITAELPESLPATLTELPNARSIAGISLFQLKGQLWLQTEPYARQTKTKDLMLEQEVKEHSFSDYYTVKDTLLKGYSEKQMAALMAASALGGKDSKTYRIDTAQLRHLTHFTEQYNFSDKILPVWQVSYGPGISKTLFVDITSGSLVKKGDTFKQTDALIFAFFHKHEFMGWAGKSAKDTSTVIGVLTVLILLIAGYRLLYIKSLHRKTGNRR
ncbi:PepSY-associated TM helix domain-containing protein [Arachidicoccus terrestris]|uniref:PepSY-associated TM helix domain-containing protein n=1 Tax=Arachidicoccus terrestris TaxID=2875539 RepID=UPI001CC417A4|nr:PepSY-associated TM helix domain-containing protein [Arachidicoccus terrestris]UAY54953.1 PepSY domain-containing protein [Arachidicoccus terrestris]